MTARFLAPLLFALSLLPLSATPASAQRGGESVLLLGVQRAGKVDLKLTKSLRDALTRGGETLAKDTALAAPERLCSNETCLSQLASRESASAVLGAQLQDSGPGMSQSPYIILMLYDAERQTSGEERTICDKCTPPQTLAALVDLSKRLLADARSKRAAAAGQPSPTSGESPASATSGVTPDPTTSTPAATAQAAPAAATSLPTEAPVTQGNGDFFSRWPTKRKIAAGVMAGLLVATLIPTIALFATDGQDTSLVSCTGSSGFCKLQNKPLWAAGFGISGALAIGIGITFAWPSPKTNSTSQAVQISSLPEEVK